MSTAGLVLSDLAKRNINFANLNNHLAPRQNIGWLNEINIKGNVQILVILLIIAGIFVISTTIYHCGRHIPVLDLLAWLTCHLMDVVEFVIYFVVLVVKTIKYVVVGTAKYTIRFFKLDLSIFSRDYFSLNFWKTFFRKLFRVKEEKEIDHEANRDAIEKDEMSHLEPLSPVHIRCPTNYPMATIRVEPQPSARVGRREFANSFARSVLSEQNVARLSVIDITDDAKPVAARPRADNVPSRSFVWSSSSSE